MNLRTMQFSLALGLLMIAESAAHARFEAGKNRVVILGVDGMGSTNLWRPVDHGIEAPLVPNLDRLRVSGAYTLQAQIDPLNWSGPNWYGMITGSTSDEHGVYTNDCESGNHLTSIAKALKAQRPSTIVDIVHEWETIPCYFEEGTVNHIKRTTHENETADVVIAMLLENKPDLLFAHFDRVDGAGHAAGGSSTLYKETIESVDAAIGRILAAIAANGLSDSTYVIITADHGHMPTGGRHSTADDTVPFILAGPAVTSKGEITEHVRNNQVAPLAAYLLGIAPSPDWVATVAPFDRVLARQ